MNVPLLTQAAVNDFYKSAITTIFTPPIKEVAFEATRKDDKCIIVNRIERNYYLFARADCIAHESKVPGYGDGVWIKKTSIDTMELWKVVQVVKIVDSEIPDKHVRKSLTLIKLTEIPVKTWEENAKIVKGN